MSKLPEPELILIEVVGIQDTNELQKRKNTFLNCIQSAVKKRYIAEKKIEKVG